MEQFLIQRFEGVWARWHHALRARSWFPQFPLALLIAIGGVLLLNSDRGLSLTALLPSVLAGQLGLEPALLPRLLIGVGMLTMAMGLLFRSRVAWVMASLLTVTAAVSLMLGHHSSRHALVAYYLVVLIALAASGRKFDRSSVAASTLFALTSVVMLLLYATFGAYYLGNEFTPAIHDLTTAFYFAIVTTSTVGYGDIVPHTPDAKFFCVSLIVLGITVFATSLTAVIAPLISRGLKRIVDKRLKRMDRKNHFIVIGDTPLATNTWRELAARGQPVTRILREVVDTATEAADSVVGDPGNIDVLNLAGCDKARAVLAMLADDSDNAFVVLAVREISSTIKTVVAVNDARHLARIRLVHPDIVIAPQVLGGELAAKILCGEEVSSEFVLSSVLHQTS